MSPTCGMEIGVRGVGENIDMVGKADAGVVGEVTDVDVLSHTSKLTCVR